jgi:ABC-type transport system involved in cytochrome c biogenesis permease subunit
MSLLMTGGGGKPMSRPIRSLLAALVAGAMVLSAAAPAFAAANTVSDSQERAHEVPVLFDALVLRPVGMMVTAVGTVGFCAIAPIMAITRPTDMGKPFRALVIRPARFTWADPLGHH